MTKDSGEDFADQLRTVMQSAIDTETETLYSIAKATGVGYATVTRFLSGERPDIRVSTFNALCSHFGLELRKRQKRR